MFVFSYLGSILNNSIPIEETFTWNIIEVSGHPWSTLSIEIRAKIQEYFLSNRNNVSVSIFVTKPIDKESLLDFIGVGNEKNEKNMIFLLSYTKVRSRYFSIKNRNLLYVSSL